MAELKTRRPDKNVSWHHRVLLSAEPGAGAEWTAAEITCDPRLAGAYWLEVGPDANADLYAKADGADFDVIVHDGTWLNMYEQVCAAWDEARALAVAGYPTALIVTSMSGVHAMFNDTADRRARRQHAAALTARGLDPAAAFSSEVLVEIHPDLWKLMNRRHQQLMAKILTWPGPVVMTARETRALDGRWQLRANDQLGFDVTAWVRLTRDEEPEILVLDTAQHRRLTRSERAALRSQFTLSRLIWDWSDVGATAQAPEPRAFDADQVLPGEQPVRVLQAVKSVRPPSDSGRRVASAKAAVPVEPTAPSEPLPSEAQRVADLTEEWLHLHQRDQVQSLWDRMTADASSALDTDIAGLLSDQDREVLGVAAGESYTLKALAECAAVHVRRTGTTVTGREQVGVA
jgi:hypothetical protein